MTIEAFFSGNVRLLRWGDTANAGLTVTFELEEPAETNPFKGQKYGAANGQMFRIHVVAVDDDQNAINPRALKKAPARSNIGSVSPNAPETKGDADNANAEEGMGKRFRDRPRSQQAYLMLQKPEFCEWLTGQHNPDPFTADACLKRILGVTSKSELDTFVDSGKRWAEMLTTFAFRDRV